MITPDPPRQRRLVMGLLGLAACGVIRDAWLLFRFPVAAGTDGYY
jgi:hypothetical protein